MKVLFIIIFTIFSLIINSCDKETKETYTKTIPSLPKKARVLSDLIKIRNTIQYYKLNHNDSLPLNINDLNLDLYYNNEYRIEDASVKSKHYPGL
jgi:hypothetical protein